MGRSHPHLPRGHWAGSLCTCTSHRLPDVGLSLGDTMNSCDTAWAAGPWGKHHSQQTTARSGQDLGLVPLW